MWIIHIHFYCGFNNWSISIELEKKKHKRGEHTNEKNKEYFASSHDTESFSEVVDTQDQDEEEADEQKRKNEMKHLWIGEK